MPISRQRSNPVMPTSCAMRFGLVARARGMADIARKAGLNRESLYKALGESGNPEFGTVTRIVQALGLTPSARPAARRPTTRRRQVA